MILNFQEWLIEQVRVLEEDRRTNVMANDDRVNLDQSSFLQEKQSGIKHWVINNSVAFLRDSLIIPTERQKLAGTSPQLNPNMPNPMNYSTFEIINIEGDVVTMKRNVSGTYVQGKTKQTSLKGLRDVTDSFEQMHLGSGGKNRYYINIFGAGATHSKTSDGLYKTYMQLTKAQASDPQNLHVLNVLGGEERGQQNVKNALNTGAADAKDKMWMDFADRINRGENLTSTLKQALKDEETGTNLLDNPRFVYKLQKMGAENIVDQMKWTGNYGTLTPDESSLLRSLQQIDQLAAKGQTQVLDQNPQVDSILKNPMTPRIAKVLSLRHLAAYLDANYGSDLITKIHQMPQPKTEPSSNPLEDLMNQQRQAAVTARNPAAAMNAPMPLTKAESVRWLGVKLLGESTRHYKTY